MLEHFGLPEDDGPLKRKHLNSLSNQGLLERSWSLVLERSCLKTSGIVGRAAVISFQRLCPQPALVQGGFPRWMENNLALDTILKPVL